MPRPLAIALLSLALCQGCSLFVRVPALDPLPQTRCVLCDVKYTPQVEDWDCGPACLTTVMRTFGSDLTLADVKKGWIQRTGGGSIVPEMVYAARTRGFATALYEGNINDLRRTVLAGQPLILLLHPVPRWIRSQGHYVVAVGYDDDRREIILHSGSDAFGTMSYRNLQIQWDRSTYLTLRLERKERPEPQAGPPAGSTGPPPPSP